MILPYKNKKEKEPPRKEWHKKQVEQKMQEREDWSWWQDMNDSINAAEFNEYGDR